MSSPFPLTPVDPSYHAAPEESNGLWNPSQLPQFGFPPEAPRHPPYQSPEWSPRNPEEAPLRKPTPIPDWSPSSAAEPPIIGDPQYPTKHDSPARPDGKHDLGDHPDERNGPEVEKPPGSEPQPADEGGDIEEPGAQNSTVIDAASTATSPKFTPSGRLMRPTTQEAYY